MVALAALGVAAQTRSGTDVFQKISLKASGSCAVPATGEVTALVKNGVELSVTEDWDCDGVPDAYDNCVGMPNPAQVDTDGNGIGDVCEAATIVKAGSPVKEKTKVKTESRKSRDRVKGRSNKKAKGRREKAADRHSRSKSRRRR
jgi:hypothetical protein